MKKNNLDAGDDLRTNRFYHGTRANLNAGNLIEPGNPPVAGEQGSMTTLVYLTPNLDEAIWDAELAAGDAPSRVYLVVPRGEIGDVSSLAEKKSPGHPSMSRYSHEPLRVVGEVTEWILYHGTRADLQPGDLIGPGYSSNYGKRTKAPYVYFTRTLDAATWGAELAVGDGPGRIYIVEPTGAIEEDPDLTNRKFRGNPTKSFRSRDPLRVTGEVAHWQRHPPEALKAMKDGLKEIERLRAESIANPEA